MIFNPKGIQTECSLKFLGWGNSWDKTPEEIIRERDLPKREFGPPSLRTVVCEQGGWYYHYDETG